MTTTVSKTLQADLAKNSKLIRHGKINMLLGWYQIGKGLLNIKEGEQFIAANCSSFKEYCEEHEQISQRMAQKTMLGAGSAMEWGMSETDGFDGYLPHLDQILTIRACTNDLKSQKKLLKIVSSHPKPEKLSTAAICELAAKEGMQQRSKSLSTNNKTRKTKSVAPAGNPEFNGHPAENVVVTTATHVEPEVKSENATETGSKTFTGKPEGGTAFHPETFDPAMHEPPEPAFDASGVPEHIVFAVKAAKESSRIQKEIRALYKRIEDLCAERGAEWTKLRLSDFQRHTDQMITDLKASTYSCNCPQCKNNVKKQCNLCAGRGFLDDSHAGRMTDADKKWVEQDRQSRNGI